MIPEHAPHPVRHQSITSKNGIRPGRSLYWKREYPSRLALSADRIDDRVCFVDHTRRGREHPVQPLDAPQVDGHQRHERGGGRPGRNPLPQVSERQRNRQSHEAEGTPRSRTQLPVVGFEPVELHFLSERGGEGGERARRAENGDQSREDRPSNQIPPRKTESQKAFGTYAGENGDRERADEENRGRSAKELGAGNDRIRNPIERSRATQGPQNRDDEYHGPEYDVFSSRVGAQADERRTGDHEDDDANVVAVQVNSVPAPVSVEHSGELRQVSIEKLAGWPGIGCRDPIVSHSPSPWRPSDIFAQGEVLHRSHRQSDQYRRERGGKALHRDDRGEAHTIQ